MMTIACEEEGTDAGGPVGSSHLVDIDSSLWIVCFLQVLPNLHIHLWFGAKVLQEPNDICFVLHIPLSMIAEAN